MLATRIPASCSLGVRNAEVIRRIFGEPPLHVTLVRLGKHPVLRGEVMDDRALADLQLGGDVAEVRAVVAALGDMADERVEDQLTTA
jgi:hypothetical protein